MRYYLPNKDQVFNSPYGQYEDHNGETFEVLRVVHLPEDNIDEEVLPMYEIKFEDGETIMAWPEEIGLLPWE